MRSQRLLTRDSTVVTKIAAALCQRSTRDMVLCHSPLVAALYVLDQDSAAWTVRELKHAYMHIHIYIYLYIYTHSLYHCLSLHAQARASPRGPSLQTTVS